MKLEIFTSRLKNGTPNDSRRIGLWRNHWSFNANNKETGHLFRIAEVHSIRGDGIASAGEFLSIQIGHGDVKDAPTLNHDEGRQDITITSGDRGWDGGLSGMPRDTNLTSLKRRSGEQKSILQRTSPILKVRSGEIQPSRGHK
jgi:hypothetical protein